MPLILYPGLMEFIKKELKGNKSSKELYKIAKKKFGYSNDIKAFYKYISRAKNKYFSEISYSQNTDSVNDKFITILEKRKNVRGDELCEELSCSPGEIFDLISHYRSQGYEIICDDKNIILSTEIASEGDAIEKPLEEDEIIFGVMSDLHFGSKECQITAMNEFSEICKKEGVKYMFVPGDVFAGYGVYPGQQFEVYAISAEEQEESAIVNLPRGFQYYMLGGNHDYSFIKRGGGHNPLLALEAQRDDVHYLGFDDMNVPILPGVDMKLFHPSGGVPYSYSYRIQKTVEQIAYSELSKISRNVKNQSTIRFLLCGHLHIQLQALFGTILGMQCGCFEGQTSYLRRKGLFPTVGGYIVKVSIRKQDGMIISYDTRFYVFPDYISDDWKNYNHSLPQKEQITKPIFS